MSQDPINRTDPAQILFVLGVHRSGTSALCAALAASGASFGEQLIDPMAGVNDEGFWEDVNVVALNEQLLALTASTWYAPAPDLPEIDWSAARFDPLREQGMELLKAGFGSAALQVVKDPRLCLTLPFWLSLSAQLGIPTQVCVISRAPLEVARSLEKRDGFPLGYGLRLYASYIDCISRFTPADALRVVYSDLLQDTPAVMQRLSRDLPVIAATDFAGVVKVDLRHQAVTSADPLSAPGASELPMAQLLREIEASFPADQTLREFASTLVTRGQELSRIGAEHTQALATLDERGRDIDELAAEHRRALATLDERDADIESLSVQHQAALAIIKERDEQIGEFDRRLSKLGEEHTHAQQVVRERDAQVALLQQRLDYIYKLPGVGFVIRRLRKNAQG